MSGNFQSENSFIHYRKCNFYILLRQSFTFIICLVLLRDFRQLQYWQVICFHRVEQSMEGIRDQQLKE